MCNHLTRAKLEKQRGAFYERQRQYSLAASCYRVALSHLKKSGNIQSMLNGTLINDRVKMHARITHCEAMLEQEQGEDI